MKKQLFISALVVTILLSILGTTFANPVWIDCYQTNTTIWQFDANSVKIMDNGDLSTQLKLTWTYGRNKGYYAIQNITFRPSPLLYKEGLYTIYDSNNKVLVSKDNSIKGWTPMKDYDEMDNMRRNILDYIDSHKNN